MILLILLAPLQSSQVKYSKLSLEFIFLACKNILSARNSHDIFFHSPLSADVSASYDKGHGE